MKFIDEITIQIQSGRGGPGAVSFRREKFVPRGGPDGGDGGKGGDVIFRVSDQLTTLVDYRSNKTYKARSGEPGSGSHCHGAGGEDLILSLPKGTLIWKDEELIGDLGVSDEVIVLKGGRGGKGNSHFRTSVNQTPEYAQPGEPGESAEIRLELRLIADVGLLGLPNAGKSTFVSRVSKARPRIADYPFTTLIPQLGVVSIGEGQSFVIADLPGLIEGAHQGQGLGIQFLKHLQRTRALVHLLDASSVLNIDDVIANYEMIRRELALYSEDLLKKPEYVCLNKVDTWSEPEQLEGLRAEFFRRTQKMPHLVSAVSGYGLMPLMYLIFSETLKNE